MGVRAAAKAAIRATVAHKEREHQKESTKGQRELKEFLKYYFQRGIDNILRQDFWDNLAADAVHSVQAFGYLRTEYIDDLATRLQLAEGRRALLQKARDEAAHYETPKARQGWHGGKRRRNNH